MPITNIFSFFSALISKFMLAGFFLLIIILFAVKPAVAQGVAREAGEYAAGALGVSGVFSVGAPSIESSSSKRVQYLELTKKNHHHAALRVIAGAPIGVAFLDLYQMRLSSLVALNFLADAAKIAEAMLTRNPKLYALNVDLISLYYKDGDFTSARKTYDELMLSEAPSREKEAGAAAIALLENYNPFYLKPEFSIFPNNNINSASGTKTIYVNGLPLTPRESTAKRGFEINYYAYFSMKGWLPKQTSLEFFVNPSGRMFLGPALTSFSTAYNRHHLKSGVSLSNAEGASASNLTFSHVRSFPASKPEDFAGSQTFEISSYVRPHMGSSSLLQIQARVSRYLPDEGGGVYSLGPSVFASSWLSDQVFLSGFFSFQRSLRIDSKKHYNTLYFTPSFGLVLLDIFFKLTNTLYLRLYDVSDTLIETHQWDLGMDLSLRVAPLRLKIFSELANAKDLIGTPFEGILEFVPVLTVGYEQTFSNHPLGKALGSAYALIAMEKPF